MIRRIVEEGQPVPVVAAGFGISDRCAFKWLARFRAEGQSGLMNSSSRPKQSPTSTHPMRVARVLALRRRRLPAFQIARQLRLSKATVCRLLARHGHRIPPLEPPPPVRRYERALPGELVHFDIKKLARIERTGHRITGDRQHDHVRGAGWEYLHVAIDDHSRLAFAQILPDESSASAIAFLHDSLAFFSKHAIKTQRIYSDNGSCYRSKYMRAAVASLGLKHRFTQPYTPKTNGKAERFIKTSLNEWAYAHSYSHSDQRSQKLQAFLHHYNWHRPHHSLKLLPPASRIPLPMNNLLRLHS